ncbi:MAG: hypothetical protein ABI673_07070 [Novosphingobium sp.]
MAENEVNNAGIKSVTLHSRDDEVSTYTAAADQKRLSRGAIDKVSAWELSNLAAANLANLEKRKQNKCLET